MAIEQKYVTQQYAARILGVSQGRVSQMIREGAFDQTVWRKRFSISLEEVLRAQQARVVKLIGKRPAEFMIGAHDHERLRQEMCVEDIAEALSVTMYKARQIMNGYLRTVSIGRGNKLYTLFAEVQRYKVQHALGEWRSYHTKVTLAMARYQFGTYDIAAEQMFAEEYVQKLMTYSSSLEAVTRGYIEQRREETSRALTTVESREEWDATILRNPPLAV